MFVHVSLLPSARQRSNYVDCLEVDSEYYQNCSVLDRVTQCSQSAAQAILTGPADRVCRIETLTPCIEDCNMVEWFWWYSSLISMNNWFNHPQNDL